MRESREREVGPHAKIASGEEEWHRFTSTDQTLSSVAAATGAAGASYPLLLRENVALAKENARLKKRLRDLTERKLQLQAYQLTRAVMRSGCVDEQLKQEHVTTQLLSDARDSLQRLQSSLSDVQSNLSFLVGGDAKLQLVTEGPVLTSKAEPELQLLHRLDESSAELERRMTCELESKENVDPTQAPKKVKRHPTNPKSSTCRLGNMIIKRNSWNLAFEPLRPAIKRSSQSQSRVVGRSVYDFD